jgi:hypothetical protein
VRPPSHLPFVSYYWIDEPSIKDSIAASGADTVGPVGPPVACPHDSPASRPSGVVVATGYHIALPVPSAYLSQLMRCRERPSTPPHTSDPIKSRHVNPLFPWRQIINPSAAKGPNAHFLPHAPFKPAPTPRHDLGTGLKAPKTTGQESKGGHDHAGHLFRKEDDDYWTDGDDRPGWMGECPQNMVKSLPRRSVTQAWMRHTCSERHTCALPGGWILDT